MSPDRLTAQLAFIAEIDALKHVQRQTWLADGSRRENSAEHSWHIALMALLLAEHAPQPLDILRVVQMLLLHDLVEIDAGDTFCYDEAGHLDKAEREQAAAGRLFGLLPREQGAAWHALWAEFEAGETAEALYANALDRLQPLMLNHHSGGGSWRTHEVHARQVRARVAPVRETLPSVWPLVESMIGEGVARGLLGTDPTNKERETMSVVTDDLQQYIASDPGFIEIYDRFDPNDELIDQIRELQPEATVVIVSEAWCADCRRNVPRWTRIVEALPEWEHSVYPQEEPHLSRFHVERIPTIILFDPETTQEIGRIVEEPQASLEEDTLAMIQTYQTAQNVAKNA